MVKTSPCHVRTQLLASTMTQRKGLFTWSSQQTTTLNCSTSIGLSTRSLLQIMKTVGLAFHLCPTFNVDVMFCCMLVTWYIHLTSNTGLTLNDEASRSIGISHGGSTEHAVLAANHTGTVTVNIYHVISHVTLVTTWKYISTPDDEWGRPFPNFAS